MSISEKLLDAYKSLEKAKPDGQRIGESECVLLPEEKTPRQTSSIPDQEFHQLVEAEIHLNYATASKLWQKYSHEWALAIAYVSSKENILNKAAYFVSCLEQGWFKDVTPQPKKYDPYELNTEQKQ
ncbi:hypothetical protein SD81_029170 [Tolypothrix campylonemoides VB511288]|nr:hypothetical protein SD81_029170 [Tolypothrix campylonemoides VB511288]